jgi:uncharacterized protein (DUF1501 family)
MAAASPASRSRSTQATLFQNRDYPVLTDYRAMFAGLIQHIYGLQPASLERIFRDRAPGFDLRRTGSYATGSGLSHVIPVADI